MSEDKRVVWPLFFKQGRRPRGSRGPSTLIADVGYRRDLQVLRWLIVLNLLGCAILVCIDGESWVTRSPLFTVLGAAGSFAVFLVITILGGVHWIFAEEKPVCGWAWKLMWSGGVEPYRSALRVVVFVMVAWVLWKRFGGPLRLPRKWLSMACVAGKITLALVWAAIVFRVCAPAMSAMVADYTAARQSNTEQMLVESSTASVRVPAVVERVFVNKPAAKSVLSQGNVSGARPSASHREAATQKSEERRGSEGPVEPVEVLHEGSNRLVFRLDMDRVRAGFVTAAEFDGTRKVFPMGPAGKLVSSAKDWVAVMPGGFHDPATGGPIGPLYRGARCIRPGYQGKAAGRLVVLGKEGMEVHSRECQADVREGIDIAFYSGPLLVRDRRVVVDARDEGYTDEHLLGEAPRTALGEDEAGRLIFVLVRESVSLERLARLARDYGCCEAVNLDGGSSLLGAYRKQDKGRRFFGGDAEVPYVVAFFERRG